MSSKEKSTNKAKDRRKGLSNKQLLVILIIWVVVAWIATDLIGIGGNFRFYSKWIECGQKPLVRHVDIGSFGLSSSGPLYYEEGKTFALIRLSPQQYCTPIEAERDGLSADSDSYSYPHLYEAGERHPGLERLLHKSS